MPRKRLTTLCRRLHCPVSRQKGTTTRMQRRSRATRFHFEPDSFGFDPMCKHGVDLL